MSYTPDIDSNELPGSDIELLEDIYAFFNPEWDGSPTTASLNTLSDMPFRILPDDSGKLTSRGFDSNAFTQTALSQMMAAFTNNPNYQGHFRNYYRFRGLHYGYLYNWHVINDGRGLGPTGWVVPASGSFTFDGIGRILLTNISQTDPYWTNAMTESVPYNSQNFCPIAGGYRNYDTGEYDLLRDAGYYWSSTSDGSAKALAIRHIVTATGYLERNTQSAYRGDGFSIRLVYQDGDAGWQHGDTITFDGFTYNTMRSFDAPNSPIWLVQNLRTDKFRNGDSIPFIASDNNAGWTVKPGSPRYCCYPTQVVGLSDKEFAERLRHF